MDIRIEHRPEFAVPVKVCPPRPAIDYTQGVLPTYLTDLAPGLDEVIIKHGIDAPEWGRLQFEK